MTTVGSRKVKMPSGTSADAAPITGLTDRAMYRSWIGPVLIGCWSLMTTASDLYA